MILKLNHFLIKKLKTFTTECFSCDWFLGSTNQIVACDSDVIWLPGCFCTLPFKNFKWFWTYCVVCITQIFPIFIQRPIFITCKGQSGSNHFKSHLGINKGSSGILFLKSMSERDGSEIERLWIRMASSSIDFESIWKFRIQL